MTGVQPAGGGRPYSGSSIGDSKAKIRSSYNPSTQKFEVLKSGDTKKIAHLEHIEEKVDNVRGRTNWSNPIASQEKGPTRQLKGDRLPSDTMGMGAIFSDNAFYKNIISKKPKD